MSTPHKATPADWAWMEGNSTVDRCDAAWSRGLIELRARVEALEREAAMDELRAASADARPTVKARITRDRDETGDYLIIHDASPPASSLVERVAGAMGPSSQAVLDAVASQLEGGWISPEFILYEARKIAAALRAAADQVVPPDVILEYYERNESPVLGKAIEVRNKFLAIAAELEANR